MRKRNIKRKPEGQIMSEVLKIGQEIEFNKDFEIESAFGTKKMSVKKGDRAIVNSRKCIRYISGKAIGCIQPLPENQVVKGYDHENIANEVINRLKSEFMFDDFIADYDLDEKQIRDEIEDVLSDIL